MTQTIYNRLDILEEALGITTPGPRSTSVTSTAYPVPNATTTDIYIIRSLATGATFAAPVGAPVQGQALIIRITDNGTAQALTWDEIYRVIGVTLPTVTVANKTLYIGMIYNSNATKWDVTGVSQQE
jgi:hypothetical protein